MANDACSKKFLVSNFNNYKMVDSRPVMEQYNELLCIVDFKHSLKHKKEELTLVELDYDVAWWVDSGATIHVCKIDVGSRPTLIESDKFVLSKHGFISTSKLNDSTLWHARLGHVHFKRMQDMSKDRFCYVYLLHTMDEALDKFKVFKTKAELQQGALIKRLRTDRRGLSDGIWDEAMLTSCYLLNRVPNKRNTTTPYELWTKRKPNLNYLKVWGFRVVVRLIDLKMKTLGDRDAIFDENMFSSIPKLSHMSLINGTNDDNGVSEVPGKVSDEVVVQQPKLSKSKRVRTPKSFGPGFQLYLIEGTRASDQHSYCYNVEDDPKTFDEAMKSWHVVLTKEVLSSRFSMKHTREADVILVSTPMDTREKFRPNNGQAISQLEYSKVIGCLMYAMTCTRLDIAFAAGKLSSFSYNGYRSVLKGYTDASRISNAEDSSSTNGWVFLLSEGAISCASKMQTCITSSIMES
ncbi:zinc finger, CCHC-type containing protein [Tanacetum coccineum]